MVSMQQVCSLGLWNQANILLPDIGKDRARADAILIEPANLFLTAKKDPAQDQSQHAFGMRLGVSERERAAPRTAKDQPAFDA